MKNYHIHCVGLSRVKNLNSLFIIELNEKKISVSEAVKQEMNRLRADTLLPLQLPSLSDFGNAESVTVVFHNCRSLQNISLI